MWSNMKDNASFSHIDRYLICSTLMLMTTNIFQKIPPKNTSDYHPICFELNRITWCLNCFCTKNIWFKVEDLHINVSLWVQI